MARAQPAAKRGKKHPAPPVVAAPVSIVRRGAKAAPKDASRASAPKTAPRASRQPKASAPTGAAPQGQPDGLARTAQERRALAGFARDNPACLAGDALRDLAHERGMARSDIAAMSDEKVREQIRYRLSTIYDEA